MSTKTDGCGCLGVLMNLFEGFLTRRMASPLHIFVIQIFCNVLAIQWEPFQTIHSRKDPSSKLILKSFSNTDYLFHRNRKYDHRRHEM